VGAALVDDPLPVGADAGLADVVLAVAGDGHRLDLGRLARRRRGRNERLADDVGGAVVFADVEEGLPVGGPHGGVVLPVEGGEAAVVGAVGLADPDVVVGRAAVALAIPVAGAADVGEQVAFRGPDAVLGPGAGDLAGAAALDGDGVQLEGRREVGAARRAEQNVLAVGRPAAGEVGGAVEGEAFGLAAADGDDEDVVTAVAVGGGGDGSAGGAGDGGEVVGGVGGDRAGGAADGRDRVDVAEVAEGDQLAVGGDVGGAGQPDRLLGGGHRGRQGQRGERRGRAEGVQHDGLPYPRWGSDA